MLTAKPTSLNRSPLFNRRFLERLLPFCIAMLIVGSFLPTEAKQAIGTQVLIAGQLSQDWHHRAYHVVSFGFTALLISLVNRQWKHCILFCAALMCLAMCIELAQSLIFVSDFEWWDLRDDAYGVLLWAPLGQLSWVREVLVDD
jgi:hypothetical protein